MRFEIYLALTGPLGLVCALAGCPEETAKPTPVPSSSMRSPNAQILPAPLKPATPQSPGRDVGTTDAGEPDASRPPPDTLREDVPLPPDDEVLLDPRGVTLEARFRWHGLPSPPASPEVNPDAISNAKRKAERTLLVDLSAANRMRIEVSGPAFPVPPGTELRARGDHYGHVLVWPDGQSYRILQPGTLRALFEEGRADVGPLVPPEVKPAKPIHALGYETTSSEVSTSLGAALLHQAPLSAVGSGDLLCRTLLELLAAEPSTPVCDPNLVPLRAEYTWSGGGQLTFEVTSIVRVASLDMEQLRIPPHTPSFKADRLPRPARATLLDTPDLQSLRKRPVPPEATEDGVTEDGLVAVNGAETIRYLLVDGVPVARVPPRSERRLETLRPGRYVLSWVDFLGAQTESAHQQQVPTRVEVGQAPDAGAPESQVKN